MRGGVSSCARRVLFGAAVVLVSASSGRALPCRPTEGCAQGYLRNADGHCVLARGFCESDVDCRAGERCEIDGSLFTCEPAPDAIAGACTDEDAGCATVGICKAPGGCDSDFDCPLGQACSGIGSGCAVAPGGLSFCASLGPRACAPTQHTCGSDRDCPLGQRCVDGGYATCRVDPTTGACESGRIMTCVEDTAALLDAAQSVQKQQRQNSTWPDMYFDGIGCIHQASSHQYPDYIPPPSQPSTPPTIDGKHPKGNGGSGGCSALAAHDARAHDLVLLAPWACLFLRRTLRRRAPTSPCQNAPKS